MNVHSCVPRGKTVRLLQWIMLMTIFIVLMMAVWALVAIIAFFRKDG
jgi:hypothetical protein